MRSCWESRPPRAWQGRPALSFQKEPLRFEGHPWILAQNYSGSRAGRQHGGLKAPPLLRTSPNQRQGICQRARSSVIRRKTRRQGESNSKRSPAFLPHHNFEGLATKELREAWYRHRGSVRPPRAAHALAGNSERRIAAHTLVPPGEP